ncbi:ubiquitin [Lactobacillus hominis]|uniref:ubiquitin n=1 Tax=Lactobacillus hominis TaxID=1203033 RepID=UPI0023F3EC60|nr:ubiquitin [Lactobacillus hominis]
MKKLALVFEIALVVVPFLPVLADAIFKTNIHMSIMNMTMQWPLWVKITLLVMCISAYLYFWYAIFKEIKNSL